MDHTENVLNRHSRKETAAGQTARPPSGRYNRRCIAHNGGDALHADPVAHPAGSRRKMMKHSGKNNSHEWSYLH